MDRSRCIIYKALPKIGFLIFEYFIELTVLVFIGIFLATWLERYFMKFKRFFPSNPVTSFVYGSILPVCACSAIPIVKTMQEKMGMKTVITFIVAAPLLNPYIVMLSFSVLGAKYAGLRIVSSFVLAVSAGYVVDLFHQKDPVNAGPLSGCRSGSCALEENDIYLKTYDIFKSVLPYLIIGGGIGAGLELALPKSLDLSSMIDDSLLGNMALIIIGVPFYFCNGTDVLLLRPLLCSGIHTGTGIAFSLTSTAICITSIFMLFKFMGKRLTAVLIIHIIVVTLIISQGIKLIFQT